MHIQESGEMYLETILVLSKELDHLRAIDICEYMGYSKPSVSRGLGILKDGGYVLSDENGFLTLSDKGRELAEKIYDRHVVLSAFLESLGVDPETASQDACKMEHVISDDSFDAIKKAMSEK
ncbi:MAG: metal-dependent transcriptional regulator [Clostridia bacterium]|nr:metal-dependent transcriptional regulator [Clostridia bacterium]